MYCSQVFTADKINFSLSVSLRHLTFSERGVKTSLFIVCGMMDFWGLWELPKLNFMAVLHDNIPYYTLFFKWVKIQARFAPPMITVCCRSYLWGTSSSTTKHNACIFWSSTHSQPKKPIRMPSTCTHFALQIRTNISSTFSISPQSLRTPSVPPFTRLFLYSSTSTTRWKIKWQQGLKNNAHSLKNRCGLFCVRVCLQQSISFTQKEKCIAQSLPKISVSPLMAVSNSSATKWSVLMTVIVKPKAGQRI